MSDVHRVYAELSAVFSWTVAFLACGRRQRTITEEQAHARTTDAGAAGRAQCRVAPAG
jgi:hypothetical protein